VGKSTFKILLVLLFCIPLQAQVFIPFSYWKSMFANLTISDSPSYNYGLLPTSSDIDKVFTLSNTGSDIINNMSGSTFSSSAYNFKGGSYPGTNGTCGIFLSSGSTCTIVVTANSGSAGTFNSTVIINYTDSYGGPYLVRTAISAQFTATTVTFIIVVLNLGSLNIGSTQQLKCYNNTSDNNTIDLTTACS
jgi:hypothetical protein